VHERAVDTYSIEQRGPVGRPPFDRVLLARRARGAVAAGIEGEEAEAALAEPVIDEAEVVAAEEAAAELEDTSPSSCPVSS
jgi:hypothetical protein